LNFVAVNLVRHILSLGLQRLSNLFENTKSFEKKKFKVTFNPRRLVASYLVAGSFVRGLIGRGMFGHGLIGRE
jgi:hypothetical protein